MKIEPAGELLNCNDPHCGLQTFQQKSAYPDAVNFKALCGANLVTHHPGIERQLNLRSPPCGVSLAGSCGRTIGTLEKLGLRRWSPASKLVKTRTMAPRAFDHSGSPAWRCVCRAVGGGTLGAVPI